MARTRKQRRPRIPRPPSQRQLRVGELVRHALSEIFVKGEMRDPQLSGVTLTVTEVTITPDLRRAVAYVVPLGGKNADQTMEALKRGVKFLRGRLGTLLDLRFVPELKFKLDTSFDNSDRMRALIDNLAVRRDVDPGNESGGDK